MHEIAVYIPELKVYYQPTIHRGRTRSGHCYVSMYAQCLRSGGVFAACPRPQQAERAIHPTVILYTRKLQPLASRTTYHSMSLLLCYETPPNSAHYEASRMELEAGAGMTKLANSYRKSAR